MLFLAQISPAMFQRLSIIVLSVATVAAVSCKKSPETVTYAGTNLPLNAAQVAPTPAVASPATGTLNASYDNTTRTMSYTVTWSNTTDSVTAIRIQGPADGGYNGAILQSFANSTTSNTPPRRKSGSFSQSLAVDNVVVKETELLAGLYYVTVYTKASAAYPTGELRGQLTFQRSN
ncbi:MAG: CHRD domain-containing protein [Chitinophagaceae bacterium]|nr:MAG: CHRD domain-containing protein [Chitinophagaceae bacterium]